MKKYWFIPYIFVIFFIFLFCADAIFVYFASTTNSGAIHNIKHRSGVYQKFADKPLHYDQVLKQQWYLDVRYIADGHFHIEYQLDVDQIVAEPIIKIMRPATDKHDQTLQMIRQHDNLFAIDIPCNVGQWDIEIIVALDDQMYIIQQRIFLKNKNGYSEHYQNNF